MPTRALFGIQEVLPSKLGKMGKSWIHDDDDNKEIGSGVKGGPRVGGVRGGGRSRVGEVRVGVGGVPNDNDMYLRPSRLRHALPKIYIPCQTHLWSTCEQHSVHHLEVWGTNGNTGRTGNLAGTARTRPPVKSNTFYSTQNCKLSH